MIEEKLNEREDKIVEKIEGRITSRIRDGEDQTIYKDRRVFWEIMRSTLQPPFSL